MPRPNIGKREAKRIAAEEMPAGIQIMPDGYDRALKIIESIMLDTVKLLRNCQQDARATVSQKLSCAKMAMDIRRDLIKRMPARMPDRALRAQDLADTLRRMPQRQREWVIQTSRIPLPPAEKTAPPAPKLEVGPVEELVELAVNLPEIPVVPDIPEIPDGSHDAVLDGPLASVELGALETA